jgi:hypothetical protein
MRKITELDVLLRAQAELPAGFKLAQQTFSAGWSFMRLGDVGRLEKMVRGRGWSCIRSAEGQLHGGVGKTSQEAVSSALSLALLQLNTHFNAVEVEGIEVSSYPWFVLARVRVYPYRIQEGAELIMPAQLQGASTKVERKPTSWDSAGGFRFGGPVPLLKGLLIAPRTSERRRENHAAA